MAVSDDLGDGWADWLSTLTENQRQQAARLRQRFVELGAEDPDGWARYAVENDDCSQLGRFLALRGTWRRMKDVLDETMRSDVTARLLTDGADVDRLRRLVQVALGSLAFYMLCFLDDPEGTSYDDGYQDVVDGDPRWRLMEVSPADDTLTGRDLGGLHEGWGQLDPDRNSGGDWC
jgi:hypothetical protein